MRDAETSSRCDADALDETVMKVWGDVASEDAFKNVFGKLPITHANIKNCSGGNDTVESNRGKKLELQKLLPKRPTGMLKGTRGGTVVDFGRF